MTNDSNSFGKDYRYQPTGSINTRISLHAAHLGSGSVSRQEFDPWGSLRTGGIRETTLNDTGQRRDGTGLLSYHARYYDPVLARFISADSVVPGAPDGSMDGVALKPLTVDFHETGFVTGLNAENSQGFWFQNDDQVAPWGPVSPQGLNRYAYVQNTPLRYTDPTGHVAWWVIGGIGGAAVGFATYALTHRGDFNWKHAALYAVGGAVVGATLGAGAHAAAGFIARAGAAGSIAASQAIPAASRAGSAIAHNVSFGTKALQHAFSRGHAVDFGISGNWNKANTALFQQSLQTFVTSKGTQIMQGTYRGTQSVYHFYDRSTRLWVATDLNGNFLAGWRLSPTQLQHLLTHGNVQ